MSLMPSQGRSLGMIDCASWSLQMLAAGLARRINEESHAHDVMCKIATHLCMLPEGPVGTSKIGQHMCQISGSMCINVVFTSPTLSSETSKRICIIRNIIHCTHHSPITHSSTETLKCAKRASLNVLQLSTSCNSRIQDSAYIIP